MLVFTTAVPVNAAKLSAQTKNVKDVQTENETQEKVAEPVAPSESGASVSWTGAVVHVDVRL